MSLRVSFQSDVNAGGAFTLSLVDVGVGSVDVVSVVLHVLQWVRVAGPSGVDVTNILIEVVGLLECPCHLPIVRGSQLSCYGHLISHWYLIL